MTQEEISKNAPDGATHYNNGSGWTVYVRLTDYGVAETWLDGRWYSTRLHKSECDIKPL